MGDAAAGARRCSSRSLILVGTVGLFMTIPKGFIPERGHRLPAGLDRGGRGDVVRRDGRAPAARRRRSCRPDPDVAALHVVGRRRAVRRREQHGAHVHPPASRAASASRAPTRSSATCSRSWRRCPGMRVFLQNPPPIRIGGAPVEEPVPVHAAGHRPRVAVRPTRRSSRRRCRTCPPLDRRDERPADQEPRRCASTSTATGPPRSASSVEQIEQALYDAYGSRQVSTIYTPNNQYQVMLELRPEYQRDVAALQLLYVRSTAGALVPRERGDADLDRRSGRCP